jgi:hypothetical protein
MPLRRCLLESLRLRFTLVLFPYSTPRAYALHMAVERRLVGQTALSVGRVVIEADDRGTCVAWPHDGGRAEAYFGRLLDHQVEGILAVFREEGANLAAKEPARVRERLATVLDPEGTFERLLGVSAPGAPGVFPPPPR